MNKTCIITGGTDGIGKQTAIELALQGFDIGLVGRNGQKGDSVMSEIISKTGNESVRFFKADLLNMDHIKKLADEIQHKYDSVDVLLNNAGAYFSKLKMTDEGFESTFALNHLAYFKITQLLLDIVKEMNPGRVINVASAAHRNAELDFNDIQGINDYKGWSAYGRSKLMNIMFTYECQRRLNTTGVTFNCLHPGFVNSSFGNNNSGFVRYSIKIAKLFFAINLIQGAKTSVYLASSNEVEGISGKYFNQCRIANSSKVSYLENDQKQLWELTEKMLTEN